MDREAFVARFGGVFEESPWIADAAWEARPFGSVEGLHAAMVRAVERAPRERRLALIRAHPDLAGKAAVAGELTPESTREQAAAGLDRLTPEQYERITGLTAAYRERFGFPFVVCAREHTAGLDHRRGRAARGRRARRRGAAPRWPRSPRSRGCAWRTSSHDARISYGKLEVAVQLVGVPPLRGLPPIPESPVRALDSGLLALDVSMEVLGQRFLAAYTEGDNSNVVATDTMKNVILRHALEYDGATPEGFLDTLGRRFLGSYPEMEGLRVWARRAAVRAGPGRRRGGAQRPAVLARRRRPRGRGAGAGRATASSPRAAARSACGCSRRPARRSRSSPATTRRRCPSAPTGRCSSTSTCTGATPTPPTRSPATRRATSRRRRCATSSARSSTSSSRSRSSTSCTRWASGCWSASRCSPRSRSTGENHTHDPVPGSDAARARPQGLHGRVPGLGADHAGARRDEPHDARARPVARTPGGRRRDRAGRAASRSSRRR